MAEQGTTTYPNQVLGRCQQIAIVPQITFDTKPVDNLETVSIHYSGLSGVFTAGETITGTTSSSTATVSADDGLNVMTIGSPSAAFTLNEVITGGTSGATAYVDRYQANQSLLVLNASMTQTKERQMDESKRCTMTPYQRFAGKTNATWELEQYLMPSGIWGGDPDNVDLFLSAGMKRTAKIEHGTVTSGPFVANEILTGGTSSATARVVTVANDNLSVTVIGVSGEFSDGETITGGTSSGTAALSEVQIKYEPNSDKTLKPFVLVNDIESVGEYGHDCVVTAWEINWQGGDAAKISFEGKASYNAWAGASLSGAAIASGLSTIIVDDSNLFEVDSYIQCGSDSNNGEGYRVTALGDTAVFVYGTLAGTFTAGETVTGGTSGATGIVIVDDGVDGMTVGAITGTFANEGITGGSSGATATTSSVTVSADTSLTFTPVCITGWADNDAVGPVIPTGTTSGVIIDGNSTAMVINGNNVTRIINGKIRYELEVTDDNDVATTATYQDVHALSRAVTFEYTLRMKKADYLSAFESRSNDVATITATIGTGVPSAGVDGDICRIVITGEFDAVESMSIDDKDNVQVTISGVGVSTTADSEIDVNFE